MNIVIFKMIIFGVSPSMIWTSSEFKNVLNCFGERLWESSLAAD
jgi:hypothetical protein